MSDDVTKRIDEAELKRDLAECRANGYTQDTIQNVPLRRYIPRFILIACLTMWTGLGTVCLCVYLSTLVTGGMGKPLTPDDLNKGPDGSFVIQIIALLVGVVLGFGLAAGVTHKCIPKDHAVVQRRRANLINGVPICFLWLFAGAILGLLVVSTIGSLPPANWVKWPLVAGIAAWVFVSGLTMAVCSVGWLTISDKRLKDRLSQQIVGSSGA